MSQRSFMEGLVKSVFFGRSSRGLVFHESPKTNAGNHLISLVGGEKLEHGAVFIPGSEARHGLTAVHIEHPHRRAIESGDSG